MNILQITSSLRGAESESNRVTNSVVAKLVAGHGGLIDFESEPGRTVFRVLLPVAPSGTP